MWCSTHLPWHLDCKICSHCAPCAEFTWRGKIIFREKKMWYCLFTWSQILVQGIKTCLSWALYWIRPLQSPNCQSSFAGILCFNWNLCNLSEQRCQSRRLCHQCSTFPFPLSHWLHFQTDWQEIKVLPETITCQELATVHQSLGLALSGDGL